MKAKEKARLVWAKNPRKPIYKKSAGSKYWLDGDKAPREPIGGPKRKR